MKINKIFNNNVVLTFDDENEVIVIGRGIAFNKKNGEDIDISKIEKKFILENEDSNKMQQLIKDIPTKYIEIAYEIVEYASNTLNVKFNNHIYLTLSDHINFAIERNNIGTVYVNHLLWEIKKFYPKEYEIGLKSIELINEELDTNFDENEAANISLHLVNAKINNDFSINESIEIIKMIEEIIKIIKYHFNIEIDETSLSYERLITHLKFFFQRLKNKLQNNDEDEFLFQKIKEKYKDSFECMLKIRNYILLKYNVDITKEEMIYLTIHIQRITEK